MRWSRAGRLLWVGSAGSLSREKHTTYLAIRMPLPEFILVDQGYQRKSWVDDGWKNLSRAEILSISLSIKSANLNITETGISSYGNPPNKAKIKSCPFRRMQIIPPCRLKGLSRSLHRPVHILLRRV